MHKKKYDHSGGGYAGCGVGDGDVEDFEVSYARDNEQRWNLSHIYGEKLASYILSKVVNVYVTRYVRCEPKLQTPCLFACVC